MNAVITSELTIEPILQYPRLAAAERSFLLTVDLRSQQFSDSWPYPDLEEIPIYCIINPGTLFQVEFLGEPVVIVHRYGGTYSPARFLLTPEANRIGARGKVRITLANRFGVPMTVLETEAIEVREEVTPESLIAIAKEKSYRTIFDVEVATIVFEDKLLKFNTVFLNKRGQIIETRPCEAYYYDEPLSSQKSKVKSQKLEGESITNLKMIAIPEGEFWMGSPEDEKYRYDDESPQHKVTVSPFFMSQTPITEAQWRFVANLPQEQRELNSNPANNGDDHPVVNVRWQDAMEFCARLSRYTGRNYRLPSEAQWEYACRAIQNSKFKIQNEESIQNLKSKIQNPEYPPFHFGETITSELANYNSSVTYQEEPKGEYRGKTIPVGQFPPNAFGLYDMHGNVWEWCLDPWHGNYEGAPNDSSVWDKGKEELYEDILTNLNILLQDERSHVLRGGSWVIIPWDCRSAYRYGSGILGINYVCGFRVVCVPPRTS